jgi:hypothetical protein
MPKLARNFSSAALTTLCLTLAVQEAIAREVSMTCTNPRQEYYVRFDDTKRQFLANDTPYQAHSYTTSSRGTTVSGQTVRGGQRFNAYFGLQKLMEFNSGGEIQTDLCR